jgi:hypothetical protein
VPLSQPGLRCPPPPHPHSRASSFTGVHAPSSPAVGGIAYHLRISTCVCALCVSLLYRNMQVMAMREARRRVREPTRPLDSPRGLSGVGSVFSDGGVDLSGLNVTLDVPPVPTPEAMEDAGPLSNLATSAAVLETDTWQAQTAGTNTLSTPSPNPPFPTPTCALLGSSPPCRSQ